MNLIFKSSFYLPFLLPFVYFIKIPLKMGSFNLLDLLLCLGILSGLLIIYKDKHLKDFKIFITSKKNLSFFLVFLILSCLLNLNGEWQRSLGLLKSFFILPIFWSLLISYLVNKKHLNLLYFFYCYLTYTLSLSFLSISSVFLKEVTFDGRVKLFFESPNQLAISLSLGIVTIYYLSKKNKYFLTCLLILVPALFMTKSTGAIFAILFISISLFLKKTALFLRISFLSSILIAFLFFVFPIFFNNSISGAFENKNSTDSRIVIYTITSKIISNNFLDGIGLGNFQNEYLSFQSEYPPYPQWAVPHAHNLFLHIIATFGFPCFIFFIALLQKKVFPLKKKTYFCFLFLIYFLIHGLFDVPIWNNDQALFFWFITLF